MEAQGTSTGTYPAAGSLEGPLPEPLRNCYWVLGGRLLAGMHPWTESRSGTLARLRELKSLGVDWVCDLTEASESAGYASEYPAMLASFGLEHHRFALPDHNVPRDPRAIAAVLDAIDAAVEAGRRVYVHCRAGIGRTGLVVGCWLARHGPAGDEAFAKLNALFGASRLSATWPRVPETDTQVRFVLDWTEPERPERSEAVEPPDQAPPAPPPTRAQRVTGVFLGMAIAESVALGREPGGQPDAPPSPGSRTALAWGGNTAMTVCLAESLLARRGNDPADQMQRYLEWQRHARPTSTGVALGVPDELKRAVAHWQWTGKPIAGSHDPGKRDPHSVARAAAVALYYATDPALAIEQAAQSSRTTQQSPLVLDSCRCFAALVLDAVAGVEPARLVKFGGPAAKCLARERLKPPLVRLMDGEWRTAGDARTRATARGVLIAALRALDSGPTYEDGLTRAIDGSAAPVTAAAIYGALAGAVAGSGRLPAHWLEGLRQRTLLETIAERLFSL